jgi:hypothetical protein
MADYRVHVPSDVLDQLWRQSPGKVFSTRTFANACAQWGFDRGVEACCNWVANADGHAGFDDEDGRSLSNKLRAAMSPKPPTLAEQGCNALDAYIYGNPDHGDKQNTYNTIRAALNRLAELEAQQ